MQAPGSSIHTTPVLPYLPPTETLTHVFIQEGSPTATHTINKGSTSAGCRASLSRAKPIDTLQQSPLLNKVFFRRK